MTKVTDIQSSMAGINLEHMVLEIDLGDVVTKDGPESAQMTAVWLIQRFFWAHPSNNPNGSLDSRLLRGILDQAKFMATTYLFNEWNDLGERAKIAIMNDAEHTGWHTSKYFNYENLEGLLTNILEDQETTVGISNWTFIVKELLPAAERYGIPAHKMYGMATQAKKLRELVPTARKILAAEGVQDKEKEKLLRHFIEEAADNEVSHSQYKKETSEFRQSKTRIVKLVGYECIMPNQETWIVIRCPRPLDERTVELLIEGKVDLRVTEWGAFTSEIVQMMKSFGKLEPAEQDNLIRVLEGRKNGRQAEEWQGEPITASA